jgi:methylmalonyl-CoA/ethylmalonyl-CoA epimerase
MQLKAHHIGISVSKLDDSINWYSNILGFKLTWKTEFADIQTKIAFLKNENIEIELFEAFENLPLPKERFWPNIDLKTNGTKHIAFEVENIIQLFELFKSKDIDIALSPRESPPKDALFGFIRDPSGVLIEFIEKY